MWALGGEVDGVNGGERSGRGHRQLAAFGERRCDRPVDPYFFARSTHHVPYRSARIGCRFRSPSSLDNLLDQPVRARGTIGWRTHSLVPVITPQNQAGNTADEIPPCQPDNSVSATCRTTHRQSP